MKSIIKNISLALAGTLLAGACTNLDEEVFSDIPMDDFFQNEKNVVANAGRAYTKLQGYNGEQNIWTLLLQTSDECTVPAYQGSWYSGGRYQELQENHISPSQKLLTKGWTWTFNGIAACNEILYETELANIDFEGKDKIIAEMKTLRALFYYQAMAGWANIPFTIDYTETGYPEQKDRKFIFNFLEQELSPELISHLDAIPTPENYGRVNQATAYSILAHMYLNAEKWFGTPMFDKCEAVCRQVMEQGSFIIEPDYATNFAVNNEISRENIFPIVYDSRAIGKSSDNFILYTLTLEVESGATFNIPSTPWAGFMCEPDFFEIYDPADKRRDITWLYGPQYDINGNPIMVNGVHMEYRPIFDEFTYYNVNGGRQKFDGARCCKWTFQTDGSLTSAEICQDNDFAIFRYADIVLMRAESLIRMGRTSEAAALPELAQIRTRAGLQPYTAANLTLEELYNERGRELAWEGWRHEDMIRFGTYLKKYWAHPDQSGETFRELFPIPTDILNANPRLVQNPGYDM